ncbi:hypothetical protein B0H16DRAFT_1799720 [Mycena metata]|uniref:Uncharacterized protein n=1 Tax=Mycena metata TaxID=1033252 RepID=A0AAD7JJU1_9AGAR|nr:hypothetical protein B0H16DRAFT_1799720 [Mycena metata]
MPAIPLVELLNPADEAGRLAQADMRSRAVAGLVDLTPQLDRLARLAPPGTRAPLHIQQKLGDILDYFHELPQNLPLNVQLNQKTRLSKLYRYPLNTVVEYPETGTSKPVGHLFRLDPDDWQAPELNIAYSKGHPGGQTRPNSPVFVSVLVDSSGTEVPCISTHSTCHGVKVCPRSDIDALSEPHTFATRELISTRLKNDREDRLQLASPNKEVFARTAAYLTALRKLGCCRPLVEITALSMTELETKEATDFYNSQVQRGYRPPDGTCEGRLVFEYDAYDNPVVRSQNRDHFYDNSVGTATGAYNLDYIEAVLCQDDEEIERIEQAAFDLGYGPLSECTTVTNASSQKAFCPFDHRTADGELNQPLMIRLECSVKFRVFQPLEEFRHECPYILITSFGSHTHPIPLPTKTPPFIRTQLFHLFDTLAEDLPDITPRRFLRHPILKSFLASKFTHIPKPTLSDLHISLANRSHLKAYIKQAKEFHCPFGTGWQGVVHLKALQDENLPPEERYIRSMMSFDIASVERHEEDEWDNTDRGTKLRIIVCMYPKGSKRLLEAGRYLQSDIAFKRIVGFLEFEIACMERGSNTSIIFCRVFLNRQSAVAHQHVFAAIEDIVFEDTGKRLRWRHLHATSLDDYDGMILEWAADQHRGQAKGLGLHLQNVAAQLPPKQDLHEINRTIQSLGPYEHLERLFRLCSNHYYRNIKTTAVTLEVKQLMRSLLCLEHPNWDLTLNTIREKGGKAGNDWLRDKETSGWERSRIPWDVWRAGDSNTNLVESVHSDVNREGVRCTLLGGLQKGQSFDVMRLNSLEMNEQFGIRPSYSSGHLSENAFTSLRKRGRPNYISFISPH